MPAADPTDRATYTRAIGIEHDPLAGPRRFEDELGRDVAPDLVALMGDTPLVRLDRLSADVPPTIIAKLEMLNPGGSVKDRIGITMIEAAEKSGDLKPGGTIVEPTSGNTGVGLAIVAARKGYKCIFVVPDKVSSDKIQLMRAYGAEVVVCPTSVEPDDPRSYYSVSNRLAEQPNHFKPNQYENQANPFTHVLSTGPEIWRQTNGKIDAFVCGVGTGGTATGIGRYLKDKNPDIQVIGADPEGSLYSGDTVRPYLTEGIGEDFWPSTFDPTVVDRWERVSDAEAFEVARRCSREEGILVGGSCGSALVAALRYAKDQPPDATIVVLLPDSGRGYLSKLYDDNWMTEHGFLTRTGGKTRVREALTGKGADKTSGELPGIVHCHADESVATAIDLLREFGVSQMPVLSVQSKANANGDHPEVGVGDILGSIREIHLLDEALKDPETMRKPVGDVMQPPLPMVDTDGELDQVFSALSSGSEAVVVAEGGRPVGVLTRADLLAHLAEASRS